MRYSSHIESCLQAIEAAAHSETDIILVQICKLQKIVEEIRASGLHNSPDLKGPIKMYVSSFETALHTFMEFLPENLRNNSKHRYNRHIIY